jgi:hypothetical protein
VVAGTPQRFGFDREGRRFSLAFTTRLPDGRAARGRMTEVFVPRRHYGRRYRVELARGELTGGLDGQRLALRACPGAPTVELNLTPGRSRNLLTCAEQPAGAGGGGPAAPPTPTGRRRPCPSGNSRSVRCSRTTLANGRRASLIVGSARPESLVGTPGRDVIVCGSGADRVRGRSGDDRIRCGPGGDRIDAGGGRDRVFGGLGRDRVACGGGRDRAIRFGRDVIDGSCERRGRVNRPRSRRRGRERSLSPRP